MVDRPLTAPQMGESYFNAGWVSWLGYRWLNPLVEAGWNQQVSPAGIPRLGPDEDVFRHTEGLVHEIDRVDRQGHKHVLIRAVVLQYWPSLLCMQTIKITMHFFNLLHPFLLQRLLVFQESQNGNTLTAAEVTTGLQAIALFLAFGVVSMFLSSQVSFYSNRVQLRISLALRGAVLVRCVRGTMPSLRAPSSDGKTGGQAPQVFNVLSFDVGPNISIIWVLLDVWIFPVQFLSTLFVLLRTVDKAAYAGLAVILVATTINGILSFMDGLYREWLLRAKDVRLDRCNESFSHIRTLSMLAWTNPFEQQVLEARRRELHYQHMRLWMEKLQAALNYTLTTIVTLATLAYFVIDTGKELKASVALPVISLVGTLIGPLAQFPSWVNEYLVWRSAYARVNRYLDLVDVESGSDTLAGKLDGRHYVAGGEDLVPSRMNEIAGFKRCSLTWNPVTRPQRGADAPESLSSPLLAETNNPVTLKDLDFTVKSGDLLALVGKEGQGKSSVFAAMLGELAVVNGSAFSPAFGRCSHEQANPLQLPVSTAEELEGQEAVADGPLDPSLTVSYKSQDPAIVTGSVRSNVIFSANYNETLYKKVLKSCCLETDIEAMPAGDMTELAAGGATLSGGQRARVALARAAYRAGLALEEAPHGPAPLVLLDDPFSALDRVVGEEVCKLLLHPDDGLLASCAVIVATADPWWLMYAGRGEAKTFVAILQNGQAVASGSLAELGSGVWPELSGVVASSPPDTGPSAVNAPAFVFNPQDGEGPEEMDVRPQDEPPTSFATSATPTPSKLKEAMAQTEPSDAEKQQKAKVVVDEHREVGQVGLRTYMSYLSVVGPVTIVWTLLALVGIMVFQNLTTLWIAYWVDENQKANFMHEYVQWFWNPVPSDSRFYLTIYASFVFMFGLSNLLGHIGEIVGGIRAAGEIFEFALLGTFARPFMWWDMNPTGRVLNRFSEDVDVMDHALTNIFGVITGAVLYFIGHFTVLAIANGWSLLLLPFVAMIFEYFASYYRTTIREVHRMYLVSMGVMYQGMVEAIVNGVTIRVFGVSRNIIIDNLLALDKYGRLQFTQQNLGLWITLRMGLVGYTMTVVSTLYPALQYFGILAPRSAALIGFSIQYSKEVAAIVQQFIMNFSDMEMQLVSIERLMEYAGTQRTQSQGPMPSLRTSEAALSMNSVTVRYRDGIAPALRGISLVVSAGEKCAIMGRTGAGKSSLLLSVLQLVPYTGSMCIHGVSLGDLYPEDVRRWLVGVVPQQPVVFRGTMRWNLDPNGALHDAALWSALQETGLASVCRAHSYGLDAPLDGSAATEGDAKSGPLGLSQGQRQLLCATRVLLRRPPLVLLDEVSSALPAQAASTIVSNLMNKFSDNKSTVLLVTHQEDLVTLCTRVIKIDAGALVYDSHRL